jgi:hypothetical protein
MFQPNPKPAPSPPPRAEAIARVLVALREEREDATVNDLLGSGFTRAEIELHRDAAVAEAARRWNQRESHRLKRAS